MMKSIDLFHSVGTQIQNSQCSQMFGKPCYKIAGKAFMAFFQDALVCKLQGEKHAQALSLEGAQLFDPSGKGRSMKEWVQIPFQHQEVWLDFAQSAHEYVKSKL